MAESEEKTGGTENEDENIEYQLFSGGMLIDQEKVDTIGGDVFFEELKGFLGKNIKSSDKVIFKFDPREEELKAAIKKLNSITKKV